MRTGHMRTGYVGTLAGAALMVLAIASAPTAVAAVDTGAVDAGAADTPRPAKVVTVTVPTATSTVGELQTWRWSANKQEYVSVLGPVRAYVGSQGVGRASESRSRTPAGVFTLTEAFGRLPNPGTDLPYRKVGLSSWWVSDVDSPLYNTFQRCRPGADCGFSQAASEQLGAISVYSHAVVIDYNRDPVRTGRGSAFFLHVTDGRPTAGCVAIDSRALVRVMRWLKPQAEPVISIGVGDAAFEVLDR